MSRLSLLWFILSTFEEYFQIIWSFSSISLLQGQVFSRKWIVRSEKGAIQISLNTIFLYSRFPSMLIFGIFNENESKNTQNVLEMSNYCVSQATIVDIWNVVLQIIIQIILHYFNLLFTHIICDIFLTIFDWKPDIML